MEVSRKRITHIVSINGVHEDAPPPEGYSEHPGRKLRLAFDDITNPQGTTARLLGYEPASTEDLELLIGFYTMLLKSLPATVLIHCHQGVSRSGAAALLLAFMYWHEPESAAQQLFSMQAKGLVPNTWMLELAEGVLKTPGALQRTREIYMVLNKKERENTEWENQ
jgi:predicted protein tyrosine phosphatase